MRSIFVHQQIPPACITGAHTYDATLVQELPADIMEATSSPSRLRKLFSPLINLRLFRKLRNYDLIIFNSSKCLYFLPLAALLRLCGHKTAAVHHLFIFEEFRGLKRLIYRLAESSFLRIVPTVISPSPYISKVVEERYGKTPFYIPIPFPPSPVRESLQLGDTHTPPNLLYTATIEPRKGLLDAVKAMAILKRRGLRARLDVAGQIKDEKYYQSVKAVIEREGLEVKFHGHLLQEQLAELRRKADLFIFPTYGEGYGMALCEAMQWGLPAISYDNTSIPYILENGVTGFSVPTGDIGAFAHAAARLLTDPSLRLRFAEAAYTRGLNIST